MPSVEAEAPRDQFASGPFLLVAGLIVLAGVASYLTSFAGAFVLDDNEHIVQNPQIRRLWPISDVVAGSARPIVYLTLAINYRLGGLDTRGYHAVNLGIHVVAALVLYAILARTFKTPRLRGRFGATAVGLAGVAALIWVSHPLQTQAVSYIIQRGESLAGLFYVLTLYAVIRGAASERHSCRWCAAAAIGCALGMATKPVMVTAPLVILIYDRIFLAESWRDLFARRWRLYAGLAATWSIAAYLATVDPNPTAGFGISISPLAYAASQLGVVLHYLRLAVWPSPLVFDYGWPLAEGARAIVLPGIVVIGLVAATLWALARHPAAAFLGVWFFGILAPTSSVIPIQDLAVEHRMYLPLAAVVVLVVVGAHEGLRRWSPWSDPILYRLAAVVAAVTVVWLGIATARRNLVYASEVSLWTDVLAKRPENPGVHYALGGALVGAGQDERAIPYLEEALRREPMNPGALSNLGVAELRLGRPQRALARFDQVVHVDPALGRGAFMRGLIGRAHFNRGLALTELKRYPEAIASYREAGRLLPGDPTVRVDLAIAEAMLSRLDETITQCFLSLQRETGPTGGRFEELPRKVPPAPRKFDKTYVHILDGKSVGQVRVLMDLTRNDAHVQFEVGGEVPRNVLQRLSAAVATAMSQSGAEQLDRPAVPAR